MYPTEERTALSQTVGAALREASTDLCTRWLQRIAERVAIDDNFIFPSEDLLDHIPVLIDGIAGFLDGETDDIAGSTDVILKAMELGELRHHQGFDARQILWEYEILGAVLFNFLADRIDGGRVAATHGLDVGARLLQALATIQRRTLDEYFDHFEKTIREREDRLRSFNRALSHEVKNEIGAILGAARLLEEPFVIDSRNQRERFLGMVLSNAERISHVVDNLIELAKLDIDSRRHRNVLLEHIVGETVRQLRAAATKAGVQVRIAQPLPPIEVPAAAIELCLVNVLGNAIKYHRPDSDDRWVEIRAYGESVPPRLDFVTIEITDNGRGVPAEDRPRMFERFFRSDTVASVEGTGLGLALVRDTLTSLGGEIRTEFPDSGGTRVILSLPARRAEDSSR